MIIIPKLFFRLRKAIDESPNCLFQSLIALRGLLENPRFSLMIFRFTVNHINYIYIWYSSIICKQGGAKTTSKTKLTQIFKKTISQWLPPRSKKILNGKFTGTLFCFFPKMSLLSLRCSLRKIWD